MSMGSALKVIDILRSHEQEIKERFCVKRIGLFGSFVRGDETETSDIDILVEFEDPTFRNLMNLAFFLEDLFGRRVDLLTPEGISHRNSLKNELSVSSTFFREAPTTSKYGLPLTRTPSVRSRSRPSSVCTSNKDTPFCEN